MIKPLHITAFLSSTFDQEMIKNRDSFRYELNARLNAIIGQIQGNLYLIDYEMGIPDQTSPLKILEICLDSIHSSDFFFGIIGKHPGTLVSHFIKSESICGHKYEAELSYALKNKLTVLELEFHMAVVHGIHAIFFVQSQKPFNDSQSATIQRLFSCSQKIIGFSNVTQLKEQVVRIFEAEINLAYEQFAKFDQKSKNVNIILANKLRYYVPVEENIHRITDYIYTNNAIPMQIYGVSGSGKTTTLLDWYNSFDDTNWKVIPCFVGLYYSSLDIFLQDLFHQIDLMESSDFSTKIKLAYNEEALMFLCRNLFSQIKGNYIILIDGLDKVIRHSHITSHFWIPEHLPANIKIIVSSSTFLDDEKFKRIEMISPEAQQLIISIITKENKALELQNVLSAFSSYSTAAYPPLFYYLTCRSILLKAKYNTLSEIIEHSINTLAKQNNPYCAYLNELSEHFSSDSSVLQDICIYLYITRRGLSEKTLNQLVPVKNLKEILHVMYFDLQKNNNENYLLGNETLRAAIKTLYIDQRNICDYIKNLLSVLEEERSQLGPAYCFELLEDILEQLLFLGDQQGLWRILSDCSMLANIWYDNKDLICKCFEQIEKKDELIAYWFDYILKDDQTNAQYAIPSLLFTVRRFHDASKFYAVCLERLSGCKLSQELATIHNNYGISLCQSNEQLTTAKKHLIRSLRIRSALSDLLLGDSYRNLSLFYMKRSISKAKYYAKRALRQMKISYGAISPQTGYAYLDLADIASAERKYDQAIQIYIRTERIFLKTLSHSDAAFGILYFCIACNHYKNKDYKQMVEYNLRAYKVYQNIPYLNEPFASVSYNLGQGYLLCGQPKLAIPYIKEYYLFLRTIDIDKARQILTDLKQNISILGEDISLDDWE